MTTYSEQKQLHFDLSYVGLRAQATAIGLVQLCRELQRAGTLDQPAMDRIKGAIADEVALSAPRSADANIYRAELLARLDRLFAGDHPVGPADSLAFGDMPKRE